MKKLITAEVTGNNEIAPGVFDMFLSAPHIAETALPGQFVQVYVNDGAHLLPRPLSVCGVEPCSGNVRLVYRVVGWGTERLSRMKPGAPLRLLGPLGNGFTLTDAGEQAVVGGGIGLPPLLFLCARLVACRPACRLAAFLGFRSGSFLTRDFEALGVPVRVATDDGSQGFHGSVARLFETDGGAPQQLYACGPMPMLAGVARLAAQRGANIQVSLEERMACGFGACAGCVVKIKDAGKADGWAYKESCSHGPVFDGGEVAWDA